MLKKMVRKKKLSSDIVEICMGCLQIGQLLNTNWFIVLWNVHQFSTNTCGFVLNIPLQTVWNTVT